MPNASSAAAEAGWEIYRKGPFRPSLDDINGLLAARGLGPVSLRMYRHYAGLVRHGFMAYVPVNELDMEVKRRLREAG